MKSIVVQQIVSFLQSQNRENFYISRFIGFKLFLPNNLASKQKTQLDQKIVDNFELFFPRNPKLRELLYFLTAFPSSFEIFYTLNLETRLLKRKKMTISRKEHDGKSFQNCFRLHFAYTFILRKSKWTPKTIY